PTTRLTIERPARRRLLARSAAVVLGDGLMRLTRLAIREAVARSGVILFMSPQYGAAGRRVQDKFCLPRQAVLMVCRRAMFAAFPGGAHELQSAEILRESRRCRQPHA